jgi:hypothetical protein
VLLDDADDNTEGRSYEVVTGDDVVGKRGLDNGNKGVVRPSTGDDDGIDDDDVLNVKPGNDVDNDVNGIDNDGVDDKGAVTPFW